MTAPRFHVPSAAPGARVFLPEHTAHHAREVLRLRTGAAVRVFDAAVEILPPTRLNFDVVTDLAGRVAMSKHRNASVALPGY